MSPVLLIVVACTCAFALIEWRRRSGLVYLGLTEGGMTSVHDNTSLMGERIRVLEVGGTYQSATYLDERWADPVFPYHYLFDHGFDGWPTGNGPTSCAVLGGGGYAIPKHFVAHHPEMTRVDVVEISLQIQRIAQRYFFLDLLEQHYQAQGTGRLRLHTADALPWLAQSSQHYDLIINDCFMRNRPEASLITEQAASVIRQHLTPQGRYLTNVVSALDGPDADMLYRTIQTLRSSFAYIWVYPCYPDDPTVMDNNVLIASNAWHAFEGAWEVPAALTSA